MKNTKYCQCSKQVMYIVSINDDFWNHRARDAGGSPEALLVLTSSWRESSSATARLSSALQQHGMSLFGATDVSGWPGLRGRGTDDFDFWWAFWMTMLLVGVRCSYLMLSYRCRNHALAATTREVGADPTLVSFGWLGLGEGRRPGDQHIQDMFQKKLATNYT